jgi:hypothetical protein
MLYRRLGKKWRLLKETWMQQRRLLLFASPLALGRVYF